MAFDSGYETGAEDAGSGELLVEKPSICGTRCTTWMAKTDEGAIALDELVVLQHGLLLDPDNLNCRFHWHHWGLG